MFPYLYNQNNQRGGNMKTVRGRDGTYKQPGAATAGQNDYYDLDEIDEPATTGLGKHNNLNYITERTDNQ